MIQESEHIRFDGRTAVVTGAGRGLGRAHAIMLAARGASVVVNDFGGSAEGVGNDHAPAVSVVEEIEAAGGRAIANFSSVVDPGGAESIVTDAVEAFGGLDIVINNAGILTKHIVPESGLDDLQTELDVHLIGSFNVVRAAWSRLIESKAARVVCTGSTGMLGSPVQLSYAAAKAGMFGMCRSLATSGSVHDIRVNMIAPGAFTRMASADLPANRASGVKMDPELKRKRELLKPEVVSAVVAFLASEECSLNGELLAAGGGLVARMFMAETRGFADSKLTPEMVVEHLDQIMDTRDPFVLRDVVDYTERVFLPRLPDSA